jgi:nucleotide-binding universal stress UspA family protein
MFRRILVPVDFTPKNERALRQARELAELTRGEITLVHVVETLEDELDQDLEAFYRRLEEKAEPKMAAALAALGEGGFTKRSAVVLGHRARAIADFAQHERADVVVLSSHRVDPDQPGHDWLTISYRVAILARCPVLLVK